MLIFYILSRNITVLFYAPLVPSLELLLLSEALLVSYPALFALYHALLVLYHTLLISYPAVEQFCVYPARLANGLYHPYCGLTSGALAQLTNSFKGEQQS